MQVSKGNFIYKTNDHVGVLITMCTFIFEYYSNS